MLGAGSHEFRRTAPPPCCPALPSSVVAPNEIDLRSRPRSVRVVRGIGHVLTLLVAAGCIASFVAGPEQIAVRLIAGAAGLLIVLLYAFVLLSRPHAPARLVV